MKNPKQFFKVFLTSVFVILAFVGCNNTSDVDGLYEEYAVKDGNGELIYVRDVEFKSGKFKSTDEMDTYEGTFKIIDEDVIEFQKKGDLSGNEVKWRVRIIRDENNIVIKMDEEDRFSNVIHLRKSE
jgi:hypothetical protein